jgi:hypothetical protein
LQTIAHIVTSTDCHPMFDGGILVNVMGQLKTDQVTMGEAWLVSFLMMSITYII